MSWEETACDRLRWSVRFERRCSTTKFALSPTGGQVVEGSNPVSPTHAEPSVHAFPKLLTPWLKATGGKSRGLADHPGLDVCNVGSHVPAVGADRIVGHAQVDGLGGVESTDRGQRSGGQ